MREAPVSDMEACAWTAEAAAAPRPPGARRAAGPAPALRPPPPCARRYAPAARHIGDRRHVIKVCEQSPEYLEANADDVIDLGAPRAPRRRPAPAPPPPRRGYTPNPRLYPGVPVKPQKRSKRPEVQPKPARSRRRKRALLRPVPNSRLYRPAPPRPPPPPARPRVAWAPPAPARALDTASRAALRLGERRSAAPTPGYRDLSPLPRPRTPAPALALSRHLVVTLPAAGSEGGDTPERALYQPASAQLRPREAGRAMEPARDPSPERAADGHESPSAPSEYLAEFLSAIMRRQYAEALKYCRLILQYEPQNATARGFHPLLLQKMNTNRNSGSSGSAVRSGSSSAASSSPPSEPSEWEEASGAGSLDLDSEGSASASASASSNASTSASASELCARSDSGSGSAHSGARPQPDTNGNLYAKPGLLAGDLENDNAAGDSHVTAHIVGETASVAAAASTSLQRLRAQFTCSIK